jgi:hypothetical protein
LNNFYKQKKTSASCPIEIKKRKTRKSCEHNMTPKHNGEQKCDKSMCNKCKSHDCKCAFKKSELFCTTDNIALNVDVLPGVDVWQTIANLEVCQENCSKVLHKVCGLVSIGLTNFSPTEPLFRSIQLTIEFRIVDEFGHEICRHEFNLAQDVTIPASPFATDPTTLIVDLPICFICCDRPIICKPNTVYRLQVSGEEDAGGSFVRDFSWEAIVWKDC